MTLLREHLSKGTQEMKKLPCSGYEEEGKHLNVQEADALGPSDWVGEF